MIRRMLTVLLIASLLAAVSGTLMNILDASQGVVYAVLVVEVAIMSYFGTGYAMLGELPWKRK
jgi:hypothetical protein